MSQRRSSRPVRLTLLFFWLAAVGWLAAVSGCQSDSGGGKWFALRNPFATKESASTARDSVKTAELDRDKRLTPVLRTDPRLPEHAADVARDNKKLREADAVAHGAKQKEAPSPERAADFAREMSRAKNLERSGKLAEARTAYERLVARFPDRYEPCHRLGVVADRQRRFSDAEVLFAKAIRLNPSNPDLHNDLGYCLYLQGRYEQAEMAVARAIQIDQANPRYHNNLGMIYGRQRRDDEALEQFRRGGNEADACYNLAFVLAAREDADKAKQYFQLALKADPGYDQARQAIDSLDRAAEDRQRPSGVATTGNAANGPRPGAGATAEGSYDAQPVSLSVPAAPALDSQSRDSPLVR